MTTDELRRRVHDDVGAVLERATEKGCRERVVDDEGNLVVVRHFRHAFEIEHVALRVTEGFCVESLGVGANRGRPLGEVVRVLDERRFYAEFGQGVVEQVVGSTVERGRRGRCGHRSRRG